MAPAPTDDSPASLSNPRSHATLSASYTNSTVSPITTHKFSHSISAPLASPDSTSVKDKTAYLSALRTSTKQLQEEINGFLTQKMEEDKLHATTAQEKTIDGKAKDEIEEETYGEEGVEEDEEEERD